MNLETNSQPAVNVIGAGLAGCEATWQLIKRNIPVKLYEMRPLKNTPAHQTAYFAELVCSNSLRADNVENAVGLLKEEMRLLDSLIMKFADSHKLPAGGALAVDREGFSKAITEFLYKHPLVQVINEEIKDLNSLEGIVIVATGPLTSEILANNIKQITASEYLYFYDAAAPIVTVDSLDMNKVFRASRYDKGEADYLNCPMSEAEYNRFWQELVKAEVVKPKDFEKEIFFEGCMPIEVMAARGEHTMRFGPLKPVGLVDPRTNVESYAVVQLRQDNAIATMYNLVGFQTHLKWPEQKRVFGLIPGLENAEFVRYGVMHRNTFINSPQLLTDKFSLRTQPTIFFAGQITGVEGYVESAASGLMVGINAARYYNKQPLLEFPRESAHGSLANYISCAEHKNFQPMNINFSLIPSLQERIKNKKLKNAKIAEIALNSIKNIEL